MDFAEAPSPLSGPPAHEGEGSVLVDQVALQKLHARLSEPGLALDKVESLFEQDLPLFTALFAFVSWELSTFDDIDALFESLKEHGVEGRDGTSHFLTALNNSILALKMHIVAQRIPTLMLVISEDVFQRVLMMLQMLTSNRFSVNGAELSASPKPGRQSMKKPTNPVLGCLPIVSLLLEMLALFIQQVRPSGLFIALLLEVCYLIVRSDTFSLIPGVHIDHKLRPSLVYLQTSAVAVIAGVYQQFTGSRMDITTSLSQCVQASFACKNPLRLFCVPMSANPDDIVHLSACTVCILRCSNVCVDEEEKAVKDLVTRHYRPCALFATELLQTNLRKETGYEGLQSLSDFVDEVLLAVQSPEWIIGCLLLEQVVCKLLLQVRAMCTSSSLEQKRDLPLINQMLDLLGTLAEKIHTLKLVVAPSKAVNADYTSSLRVALMRKWVCASARRWEALTANYNLTYWADEEEKSSALLPARQPFLDACEALLLICDDVVGAGTKLLETSSLSCSVALHVSEHSVEVMFALLPQLSGSVGDFSRLLQMVTLQDLHYASLVRQCLKQCKAQKEAVLYWVNNASIQMNAKALLGHWVRSLKMRGCDEAAGEVAALEASFVTTAPAPHAIVAKQRLLCDSDQLDPRCVYFFTKSIVYHNVLRELCEKIEDLLFATLCDPSSAVRAKIAKALHRIVMVDNTLVHDSRIKEIISLVLHDPAISVREEGVKIVGVFLVNPVNRLNIDVIQDLLYMLLDEGVSVRKAVVNMFKDVMQCQPDHPAYHDIAVALLERMTYPKEEESVRECIRLIFQQIWFTAPSEVVLLAMRNSLAACGACSVSSGERPSAKQSSQAKAAMSSLHIEFTALRLVKIVSMQVSHSSIERLLRELLHGRSEGDEGAANARARRQSAHAYCERIVECLVGMLLSTEELLVQPGFSLEEVDTRKGDIVATVAMFCEVHPPFVAPHILTFLPYLKLHNENGTAPSSTDVLIARQVMRIVEATAVLERNVLRLRADEVVADLAAVVFTQGGAAVNAAVSCMCALIANVTSNAAPILRISERCFMALAALAKAIPMRSTLQPAQSAQIRRCLAVLGAVSAHSKSISAHLQEGVTSQKWTKANEEAAQRSLPHFIGLEPHLLTGTCYAVAVHMYSFADEIVKAHAVQTLCKVFTGNPRLMLVAQSTRLLQQLLSPDNSEMIHDELITGLCLMLSSEESAHEKKVALKQLHDAGVQMLDRNEVLGPGDSDSDATIAGFVIQHHLDLLTRFLSHPKLILRLSTLQLLGSLLRQGMVCPLDALASLIMLQCDHDERIRSNALQLLIIQDERHPSFLDNRLREGVEMAYEYQLAIFGNVQVMTISATGETVAFFGALYASCVQTSRKRWQGFVAALVRKCTLLAQACAESNEPRAALVQTQYFVSVLASLPFATLDEVLLVLHLINRNVPYDMGVLLPELKGHLLAIEAAAETDEASQSKTMPPPGMGPSASVRPAKKARLQAASPSAPVEAELRGDSAACARRWATMDAKQRATRASAIECVLVQLHCKEGLIRLKAFLKLSYGLSDERCAAFDPSAKAAAQVEKAVTVNPGAVFSHSAVDVVAPEFGVTDDVGGMVLAFGRFVDEYNRLAHILKSDPDDFNFPVGKPKVTAKKAAAKRSPRLTKDNGKAGNGSSHGYGHDDDDEYVSDQSTSKGSVTSAGTPTRSSRRQAKRPVVRYLADDLLE